MSGGFLEALGPLRKMRSHAAIYEVIFWPRSSPVTNEAEVLVGGSTRREKLLVYNIVRFLIIRLSKNTWGMKRIFQKLQSETNRDFLACFVWKLRPNEDNHEIGLGAALRVVILVAFPVGLGPWGWPLRSQMVDLGCRDTDWLGGNYKDVLMAFYGKIGSY